MFWRSSCRLSQPRYLRRIFVVIVLETLQLKLFSWYNSIYSLSYVYQVEDICDRARREASIERTILKVRVTLMLKLQSLLTILG